MRRKSDWGRINNYVTLIMSDKTTATSNQKPV